MALTLRWKWLLHKTHNLVICLPLNQYSHVYSKMKRVCDEAWKGTPSRWRRPPFSEWIWLSKGSREPWNAAEGRHCHLLPPSPLAWLGPANFIVPRSAGKLPESKARAQGKKLGWGSAETDDLPTRPNSHISLTSEWQALVLLANHRPSLYSLPKFVSNILYADKQTLWSRLWRAYAITLGVCVYN